MTLPARLRRAVAGLHAHTCWLWTGIGRADVTVAVQMALGWVLLLSLLSIDSVEAGLAPLGVSPALTAVLYGFYIQPLQGTTLGTGAVAQLVAVFTSALGFIPTYAAYAANGGSYQGAGAAKGATLVAVGAVLAALLVVPRLRLSPLAFQAFNSAGYMLSVRLFATYWVPGTSIANPNPPNKLAYQLLFDVLFPLAAALPISALVLPAPASRKARAVFCQVVRGLGQLYGGVVDLLLLDEEPQQQAAVLAAGPAAPPPPPAAEGEANGKGGAGQPASAAARAAAKLREVAAAIRKGIQGMGLLLMVSFFEADVYAAPRRLRAGAYKRATTQAAAAETCLSLALRWAAASRRPLDRGLCRQLAPQLRAMQVAVAGLCEALAGAVEQRAPASTAVVAALEQLERRRQELSAAAAATASTPAAAVSFALVRGVLYLAATKIRAMAPLVAEAVEPQQPGASAAVAAHFAASVWLADPAPPVQAGVVEREASALLAQALPEDGAIGEQAGAGAKPSDHGGPPASASPAPAPAPACAEPPPPAPTGPPSPAASRLSASAPAIVRPSAAVEAAPRGRLRRLLLDWAGGRVALVPALHMLLTFGAAGALVVCKAAFSGLGYTSYWVAFTVNSIFERSAGRIRQRAANRILGTALGAAWSCATIGVVLGVNGGSWQNRPAKFAALVVMSALWAAFIGLNRQRSSTFSYAWSVAMVAFCVIVLEEFRATASPWLDAAWRMASVCIGIGIEGTITSCVFPVTTADLELDQLLRALGCLASLGQRVAASQAGAGGACSSPSPAAQAAEKDSGGALPEGDGDKEVREQAGLAAAAEAAEAGLVAPQPAAAAAAPLLGQARATPAEPHAQLQALAGKAKKHAGKLLALSTESVQGPMPAFARTQRRHQPTAAAVAALLHIVDSLLLATYSEELKEARRAAAGSGGASPKDAAGLPRASRHLALAVGAQFAESVHCLRLVLTRQLPLAEALPAMRALDRQLHQLAAAAGLELQPLLRPAGAALVQLPRGGGGSAKLGEPAPTISSAATLLPLAAAMLSAVPQLHNLYLSAVQAVLPEEAAAAAAVAELAEQATGSWRVMADVQQAALAASLQSEAS